MALSRRDAFRTVSRGRNNLRLPVFALTLSEQSRFDRRALTPTARLTEAVRLETLTQVGSPFGQRSAHYIAELLGMFDVGQEKCVVEDDQSCVGSLGEVVAL